MVRMVSFELNLKNKKNYFNNGKFHLTIMRDMEFLFTKYRFAEFQIEMLVYIYMCCIPSSNGKKEQTTKRKQ